MSLDYAAVAPTTLKRVNAQVFVAPRDYDLPLDPLAPSVVVLFGWFNGKLSHEKKYVDILKYKYPTTTVVLIKVDVSWLWSSQSTRETTLEPVADILDEARNVETKTGFRGVLVHVMSNGGGMQLLVLSKVLERRARKYPGRMVTESGPVALVFDSLPEGNGLRCMIMVYTYGTRRMSPLAKAAAIPLLTLLYSLFYVSYGGSVMQEVRHRLNAPSILPGYSGPGIDSAPPRLYVYSKTDKLTPTEEVLSHISAAKELGLDVHTEVFEDSPHVSHARVDPERYWGAVDRVWQDATRKIPAKAKL